jgi:hypothetical protein
MNFLKYEFDAGPADTIPVTLDKQVNVRLLDYTVRASAEKISSPHRQTA